LPTNLGLAPTWVRRADGVYAPFDDTETDARFLTAERSFVSEWTLVSSIRTDDVPWLWNRYGVYLASTAMVIGLIGLAAALVVSRTIALALGAAVSAAGRLGRRKSIEFVATPVREANVLGAALTAAAAERDAHEAHVRLLMREVNHRSKNLLTVVQTLARRTQAEDIEAFRQKLSGRLTGLAAGLDSLVADGVESGDLRRLISGQISVFIDPGSDRVRIAGPDVSLSSTATRSIGMALHELATNATKYGALSVPNGQLKVEWSISNGAVPALELCWEECRGPVVKMPSRKGFGTIITKGVLESTYAATVILDFQPGGLIWSCSIAVSKIAPRNVESQATVALESTVYE
jgi:two-component sensor histidine kinase